MSAISKTHLCPANLLLPCLRIHLSLDVHRRPQISPAIMFLSLHFTYSPSSDCPPTPPRCYLGASSTPFPAASLIVVASQRAVARHERHHRLGRGPAMATLTSRCSITPVAPIPSRGICLAENGGFRVLATQTQSTLTVTGRIRSTGAAHAYRVQ